MRHIPSDADERFEYHRSEREYHEQLPHLRREAAVVEILEKAAHSLRIIESQDQFGEVDDRLTAIEEQIAESSYYKRKIEEH